MPGIVPTQELFLWQGCGGVRLTGVASATSNPSDLVLFDSWCPHLHGEKSQQM